MFERNMNPASDTPDHQDHFIQSITSEICSGQVSYGECTVTTSVLREKGFGG